MYKKIMWLTTCLLVSNVFADNNSSAPAKTPTFLNNPAVANSRQAGSQQTFGEPKMTGDKGQKYYTKQQMQNPLNNPTVANSRQAGSQQTFGEQAITGHHGQHYNKKSKKQQNRPAVGSKQASDFLFHQDQNPVTRTNNQ